MKKIAGLLTGTLFSLLMFQNCQKSEFMVVTGVVRDSITNEPIPDTYIVTPQGYVSTDKNGTFTLNDIQPGKQSLKAINFQGYNSKTKDVVILSGRVNKIDFVLSPFEKAKVVTGKVSVSVRSAIVSGSFKLDASDFANSYGHVWSTTNPLPTVENSDNHTSSWTNQKELTFTSNLTGLQSDQIYYVRSYVRTTTGYVYGSTTVFRSSEYTGLLASYSFNGLNNYSEESGNGFSTYYIWNLPAWVPDRHNIPNNAVEFDGMWGTGLYAYNANFELNDFSISLWFNKPGAWENSKQQLYTIGYWSKIQVYISQGAPPDNLTYGISINGTDYKITLNSYPSSDTWHHLVAVRRNSVMELYLDGTLAGSANCSSQTINDFYHWMFIGFTWLEDEFRGKMDDINLFERALSGSEIQSLYLK